MKKCYIFSFEKDVVVEGKGAQRQNYLVLFFPYKEVEGYKDDLKVQLREYFFSNILPDKIFIICFNFNRKEVAELFRTNSEIYNYLPIVQNSNEEISKVVGIYLNEQCQCLSLLGDTISSDDVADCFNRGMVKIFNDNGGLIISQSAHHFVFPSGKHSNKFLRPGNVLIHGSQILFIAAAIIKHTSNKKVENIYCDTSSINSLAFAYVHLRAQIDETFNQSVQIESFGSYELFEKSKFEAKANSLFLISSSTSGSILERMTDDKSLENRKRNIKLENVFVIYGLSITGNYLNQVICDLSYNDKVNPEGIENFESYNVKRGEVCKFCTNGSRAVPVKGDVFLLEKPVVNAYLIKSLDQPAYLKEFSEYFKKGSEKNEPVIRTFYKENGINGKKYEIYIDIDSILEDWPNRAESRFKIIFSKLEKYIIKNVPASLSYIVVLPDSASSTLASIIVEVLNNYGLKFDKSKIIGISQLNVIQKGASGVIAVVSSSVVTGRNLLFLSRALREFEPNYQRLFFTMISRTNNKGHLDFLDSNLGMGEFGKDSNKLINVESIHCSQEAQNTPWHVELDFVKRLQEFCEEKEYNEEVINFLRAREDQLNDSGKFKGLNNTLFWPGLNMKPLRIRKGFAFTPKSTKSSTTLTQSEVYFIISTILNEIRCKGRLHQSEYVRNLLEPGNFVRYNDGIIQASLLRSATAEELKYELSNEKNEQMKSILGDMIIHLKNEHAEGLHEFFYAIAIRKLKLTDEVLRDCISLLETQESLKTSHSLLFITVAYIKDVILTKVDIKDNFKNLSKPITD